MSGTERAPVEHAGIVEVIGCETIGPRMLELRFAKPEGFGHLPGQRIRLIQGGIERDYSLVSAPSDPEPALCVRIVEGGAFTTLLAAAKPGDRFGFTGPHGYFTYRNSPRPAIFVATGTGIAPFVSMARSGITGFTVLHGVSVPEELCYAEILKRAAGRYVPCVTRTPEGHPAETELHRGRVTGWLETELAPGGYDFYLCGRMDMVRDVTLIIDERFPDSRVYTELFY